MKGSIHTIPALLICFLFWNTDSVAASRDSLSGSSLYPFGRYDRNSKGDLEMISSAVHFGFTFTGSACAVYAGVSDSVAHGYLQYTLDGVYQKKRIRINGNNSAPFVIGVLTKGVHTVWIYKATEAASGPIFIKKIIAPGIKAIKEPERPLIEFIGNSITCGAASDPSEIPCSLGEYHDHHNAYEAYGPRVARALHANFILSSVSGIGIYRNWNSLGPTMPQVYEKTDFELNSSRKWDFNRYHPQIISIALGTNDFSGGDGKSPRLPFDSAEYVSNYIRFVKLVKSKYPKALIILLSSPMLNGTSREMLQNCLSAVKKNIDLVYIKDKPVTLFFFEPMQARGCGGHPNVEDHEILARELEPAFRKLL
jgi:lysophospholipase L1-like esterase